MRAYGLAKLTLIDYPGKMACTVFTGGCNFRCPFCHNALLVTELELASDMIMEEEEVLQFLDKRQGILEGVCITGGEPLLQPDIASFMEKVKEKGYLIKLDTNGSFPERLKEVTDRKLCDYIAMDIKNSREKYAATVGLEKFDTSVIDESINIIRASGIDHEFRTTFVKELHDMDSARGIAQWIEGGDRYFIQNFKDSGDIIGEGYHGFESADLTAFSAEMRPFLPNIRLREIE